jgi:hypothetical protein
VQTVDRANETLLMTRDLQDKSKTCGKGTRTFERPRASASGRIPYGLEYLTPQTRASRERCRHGHWGLGLDSCRRPRFLLERAEDLWESRARGGRWQGQPKTQTKKRAVSSLTPQGPLAPRIQCRYQSQGTGVLSTITGRV